MSCRKISFTSVVYSIGKRVPGSTKSKKRIYKKIKIKIMNLKISLYLLDHHHVILMHEY